jgi:twitching motility two-component system response regulator PilG
VAGYPDGVAAFKALTSGAVGIPDLVLLNIGLPEMDGFAVALQFKKYALMFAHTVIIMLTRKEGLLDHLKGRLAGAQAYLTKPFTQQDLVKLTTTYLGAPLDSS